MFERIRQVVIKEFKHLFRDGRTVFFLFVVPVIQLMVLGYVATFDVNLVPTVFYDLDKSAASRDLERQLVSSGYFAIKYRPSSEREITDLIHKGKALCAIQINNGFSRDISKGVPTQIQVIVDGTDSNTAMIAMGYINTIITRFARGNAASAITPVISTIDFRTRVWYNPDLRSRNYMIPGVIALIIMLTCLLVTSMSVVRERESGTMEQLMVTPIKPMELMLGKTIPAGIIGFFDMSFITVVGTLWFSVPMKGEFWFLVLCTAIYLIPLLSIGLFISTISKTPQQALMASFFFFQPAILLSGFVTPIENMPWVFQLITYANPLRYFLVILRGIFLKGVGFQILWPQMAALFIIGVGVLMLSALRFTKRLR